MALLSFWLDLLLLRLILIWCGGPVGLGLRARLFPASSSSRHFAVQLLCRVQPAGLLCGSLDDVKACCTNRGSNAAYVTHSFAVISAQRRRTEAANCLACRLKSLESLAPIYRQKLSACPQRCVIPGGTRSKSVIPSGFDILAWRQPADSHPWSQTARRSPPRTSAHLEHCHFVPGKDC